jgi:hypothetical protein
MQNSFLYFTTPVLKKIKFTDSRQIRYRRRIAGDDRLRLKSRAKSWKPPR